MRRPHAGALAAVLAAGLLVAGCGLGPGNEIGGVSLLVTRDFGHLAIDGTPRRVEAPGGETALRALERALSIRTSFGGKFVRSIEGLGNGREDGRPFDWFYYVNGIEASRGAASVQLHAGDVLWWDRHDWGSAMRVPAVVGAFPEPFRHGRDGKRLPTRIECADGAEVACTAVSDRLGAAHVIAGRGLLGSRGGTDLLRVIVGPWPALRADFAARLLERGPGASGVFARPAADGQTIALLDRRGRTARTLGPRTGLIAATVDGDQPPTWIITGTDQTGVRLAAENLSSEALDHRFAVALSDDLPIGLPVAAP